MSPHNTDHTIYHDDTFLKDSGTGFIKVAIGADRFG